MPHPFPLASVFTEGMRRDADRAMLPGGSVWNLVDFVPDELGAAAEGRGGWTYAGPALSGATGINVVGYHPDSARVVAVDQALTLWDVAAGTSIGTLPHSLVSLPKGPPTYHRGKLIFGIRGSSTNPCYYDGSTITSISGSPTADYLTTYKDHTAIAHSTAFPNRVWFSAAGDPTTWDLNYGWWDTTGPVTALASTLNAILVFHGDSVERLRGTTPPPGSDMTLEPLYNDGCIDAFSIAYWGERVIWASSRGIYMTDGASVIDLTAEAQMKTYWSSLFSGYLGWRIAGGIFRDHYIVAVNNANTLIDCLCVNLINRTMWRFTNLHGASFVNVTNAIQEKLYMGQYNAGRVGELSSLWSPSASVKTDADGTIPTPIIETGAYRGYDRLHRRWIESMGLQKWRYLFLDYDLRDAAADNPTISLSYSTTPTGSYTTMIGGVINKSTDYSRSRRSIHSATVGGGTRSNMMEFKVAVNGPYATAKIFTLEGTFEPIDIGRLK